MIMSVHYKAVHDRKDLNNPFAYQAQPMVRYYDIYGCLMTGQVQDEENHGRQPHVEGDCMIACDACQTWYHRDCEGISSPRWRNLQDYDTTYTCNSCRCGCPYYSRRKKLRTPKDLGRE
ncbi:Death-inducer obliterator 1 [Chionoecetes opilio]|uniref:Death-inducer obliterator 1 n=1 Tax=Chionoecetes opilio TaxID=41210 RepID=A0A8J4YHW6_CHIOP|nr:Death-inducer obliterator 1 [Chionoecetes opilio]